MESSEVWSSQSIRRKPKRQWVEKAFDAMVLSALIVLPAGVLFAIYKMAQGDPWLAAAGLFVAALGGVGIYARLIVPFWLRVKPLKIGSPTATAIAATQRPPLKVVFFADLHVGRVKQAAWTRKVVDLVNAQHPDVVLMGGDFVGHVDAERIPAMLAPLAGLRARLGVFAVLGNHDYGLPGIDYSELLETLFQQFNVRLLHNENVTLDGRLEIVGIDELWENYADVKRAFMGAKCAPGMRRIVLGHNPDLMRKIAEPADLFIFGHTHGGQINLPVITRYIVPVDGELYRGEYHLPQGLVYVSSGCGETTTPTRLGTQVEIVSITLQ
jgi:predicted MPP superfamily phosphohydrolase